MSSLRFRLIRLVNSPPSSAFITSSASKSGVDLGTPTLATLHLRLGGAGHVDDDELRSGAARRRQGAGRSGFPRPPGERFRRQGLELLARDRADDHQGGVTRDDVLLPVIHHRITRHRLVRRLGSEVDVAIRMRGPVKSRGHDARGDLRGIALLRNQVREAAGALALHLLLRERRIQRDVGDEIQRARKLRGQRRHRKLRSSPSSSRWRATRPAGPVRRRSAARCASSYLRPASRR